MDRKMTDSQFLRFLQLMELCQKQEMPLWMVHDVAARAAEKCNDDGLNQITEDVRSFWKKRKDLCAEEEELFCIVKTVIDKQDQMKLLREGAPADEYDSESDEIAAQITLDMTATEIARCITEVMNESFSEDDSESVYADAGAEIRRVLDSMLQALNGSYVHLCPVCKRYYFREEFTVCPICGWGNDEAQEKHPDWGASFNFISLNDAINDYREGNSLLTRKFLKVKDGATQSIIEELVERYRETWKEWQKNLDDSCYSTRLATLQEVLEVIRNRILF